jgi:hypothetical protein
VAPTDRTDAAIPASLAIQKRYFSRAKTNTVVGKLTFVVSGERPTRFKSPSTETPVTDA